MIIQKKKTNIFMKRGFKTKKVGDAIHPPPKGGGLLALIIKIKNYDQRQNLLRIIEFEGLYGKVRK